MCAFHTFSSGAVSPFCGIFTSDEWKSYSYGQDLQSYATAGEHLIPPPALVRGREGRGSDCLKLTRRDATPPRCSFSGYGGPLGRAWSVGLVNEIIARLTNTPVKDHTTTNSTLDSDPATFPFDRKVYLDLFVPFFSPSHSLISLPITLTDPRFLCHPLPPAPTTPKSARPFP